MQLECRGEVWLSWHLVLLHFLEWDLWVSISLQVAENPSTCFSWTKTTRNPVSFPASWWVLLDFQDGIGRIYISISQVATPLWKCLVIQFHFYFFWTSRLSSRWVSLGIDPFQVFSRKGTYFLKVVGRWTFPLEMLPFLVTCKLSGGVGGNA